MPLRMPRPLLGLSDMSGLKEMGTWKTWAPAARAAAATEALFSSMPVSAMTPLTASWSLPPSAANSFWYSMKTTAVFLGSTAAPPLASEGLKVRPDEAAEARGEAGGRRRRAEGRDGGVRRAEAMAARTGGEREGAAGRRTGGVARARGAQMHSFSVRSLTRGASSLVASSCSSDTRTLSCIPSFPVRPVARNDRRVSLLLTSHKYYALFDGSQLLAEYSRLRRPRDPARVALRAPRWVDVDASAAEEPAVDREPLEL
mmetsp:Transcript_7936/g.27865  ORF Transcript_7936/g.27865 Transcript_7936/m.27865 type:complete len:258 (+) Transcript_7936:1115-1888(+)